VFVIGNAVGFAIWHPLGYLKRILISLAVIVLIRGTGSAIDLSSPISLREF